MKKTKEQFTIELKRRWPEWTNKEIQEYVESLDVNGWYEETNSIKQTEEEFIVNLIAYITNSRHKKHKQKRRGAK